MFNLLCLPKFRMVFQKFKSNHVSPLFENHQWLHTNSIWNLNFLTWHLINPIPTKAIATVHYWSSFYSLKMPCSLFSWGPFLWILLLLSSFAQLLIVFSFQLKHYLLFWLPPSLGWMPIFRSAIASCAMLVMLALHYNVCTL